MKKIKASEFDKLFDAGKDITEYLDLTSVKRVGTAPKRVNVDFPAWMVHCLDREAERLGLTRQGLIKVWVGDRLAQEKKT